MPASEAVAALLLANAPLWAAGRVANARSRASIVPVTTTVPGSGPASAAGPPPALAGAGSGSSVASGSLAATSASEGPARAAPASGAAVVPVTSAPPVTTKLTPSYSRAKQGMASWLDTIPPGTCANNDAPMGSTIKVTNGAGVSVTCKVVSTGPFVTGRVVDLAKSTFAQLGPVSQGLVGVAVSW